MLARTIGFSIRQRWLVLAVVALLCAIGAWSATKLPIDAVPDITNVQVQINTKAEGYSPLESEQRITYPIETAIAGIPNLNYTRSISRYGLSQVTVVFEDGTDIYFARAQVAERLRETRIGLGAQDLWVESKGAFTGAVSAEMLRSTRRMSAVIFSMRFATVTGL